MEAWLAQHIVEIIIALVAAVAAFFALRMLVEKQAERITVLDDKVKRLENDLREHKMATAPHENCPGHAAKLVLIEHEVHGKVDKEIYTVKHETLEQSVKDIKEEIASIRDTLSPLNEIKNSLDWIVRKLNGGGK